MSLLSTAATVIASRIFAGEKLSAGMFWFPAAATTTAFLPAA
jgi:hypothetical protein